MKAIALPVPAARRAAVLALLAALLAGGIHAAVAAPATAAPGETMMLNFKDAEIQALISTVSEITGRNFVVDPRVKGKVTVISSAPTDPDALYEVFLSILKVHGYSAVTAGNIVKIVPDATARQEGDGGAGQAAGGDELVTAVLAVDNINAMELVPILRPLLPQEAHLAAHAGSNALIVSSTSTNLQRLMRIIRRIDRDGSQDVEIVRLENAEAEEVVNVLVSFGQNANTAEGGMRKLPTLVADGRTNSILLGGDPDLRLEFRTLIAHLDMPIPDDGDIRVVYLRYAAAQDLVPVRQGGRGERAGA